ncbi:glycogen debranching protein [Sphingomonas dokdonensis]|nr:alpha-amylase family glycosyl hydrolase [Sphingomonas dokdonensis]
MIHTGDDWVCETVAPAGTRYGFRAAGAPPFDASKLLVDPGATHLDRPFAYDPRLATFGCDTASLVPKAVVTPPLPPLARRAPVFRPGGLIYEVNVRGLTMLHPDIPAALRGTVAAIGHPVILEHLQRLGVDAVELMPIVAWIDERHLPSLGMHNAWGYNPVVPMALDPRLCPGGMAELRATVAALREVGIGTILDLVFNHTGESDLQGPTLSFRGLDDAVYARAPDGTLINDAGTGNTLDFGYAPVREMTLAALRHFVTQAGVDGFRFDLATVMARSPGFDRDAPIFAAIAADPVLADRIMIAEPWDIGPGGYQLGQFPANWLEWNDRFRDDVRCFWRGDGAAGALATRLSGSTDLFGGARTRSVNFVAAHDGFTLADTVAYAGRHNHANGEQNRDGHGDEVSWNAGEEGQGRAEDRRALLATLFAARGTIMLTAGDEFGRTQAGNNNAYAQDNATSWLDWAGRDRALEACVAGLAAWRRANRAIGDPGIRHDLIWLRLDGEPMTAEDWGAADGFAMMLPGGSGVRVDRRTRTAEILSPRQP